MEKAYDGSLHLAGGSQAGRVKFWTVLQVTFCGRSTNCSPITTDPLMVTAKFVMLALSAVLADMVREASERPSAPWAKTATGTNMDGLMMIVGNGLNRLLCV